jgi:glycine/D-amino acid oxidase-like deaminating enzyme
VNDINREFGMGLLRNAQTFLDQINHAELEEVTLGYRVLPQDDLPVVGFARQCSNLYVAAMHSGMTMSPIIGQCAAMEILDGSDVDMLKPYRPARFA